ncbi:tetraacyldisaccharide 4'-kinase [Candidatus Kinetoplastidibacterium galati]|uniref:Tetraacyldisaccharide 4'-kinase n=1 Tax=Candidatus Kinetoplastidibacterium galati TCC219 TaxID=1208921 RepID=M1M121_9PROT|nr:tetraacyldisaccharide 4'-kinase [Candidatus Kinetoplastibacterium galatii]AGF48994.1 tetraacyldisaccharide 4'-kinase [Candidatus Kinetoplastibacterium galatii TCC219]
MNYNKVNEYIHKQWMRKGLLSNILYPISQTIKFLLFIKNYLYKSKILKVFRARIPIIVVGNIYIGGTGKTPVVISITKELKAKGWNPGIISRGYGVRIGNTAKVGYKDVDYSEFGDEPTLITKKTGAPISVHPKRCIAIKSLLHNFPNIDIIISDDGLQHSSMERDFEIIVQDNRGIGNGRLIPSGPLRDSVLRLDQVDLIVSNRINCKEMINKSICLEKSKPYHIDMYLRPEFAFNISGLKNNRPISYFNRNNYHRKIVAISGIGNNERFIKTLNDCMIYPSSHIKLMDHCKLNNFSFCDISADAILITSKDAVKYSGSKDPRIWEISVAAEFSDKDFFSYLSNQMHQASMKLKDHL